MKAKTILLTTAIALMTVFCANTKASNPKLQAVFVSNESTIAVESVEEIYLKYSRGEYLIFIILNERGQNIFKNALSGVSDQKMGINYGDTVLTPPLPIKTDTISAMFKQDRITFDEARKGLKIFQSFPLRYVETNIPNALRLSKEIKVYAYDAYLLDCAIRYKSPLLTLDLKLKAAAQSINIEALEV